LAFRFVFNRLLLNKLFKANDLTYLLLKNPGTQRVLSPGGKANLSVFIKKIPVNYFC